MSFSGAEAFQFAVMTAMALFMVVLGYETIAQALAEVRDRKAR